MTKLKKTYRLDDSTVIAIEQIKKIYERNTGVKLSDSSVINVAIFELGNQVDEKLRSGEWK